MNILNTRQVVKSALAIILIVALTATNTSGSPIENYLLRKIVINGIVETADVRQDIINYYIDNKIFPKSNEDIGKVAPLVLASGDEVVLNENGFVLYLRNDEQKLSDKSIEFRPFQGESRIEWDCTGGDLEHDLRPTTCQH